jgi:GT2 family glycosyltransferase
LFRGLVGSEMCIRDRYYDSELRFKHLGRGMSHSEYIEKNNLQFYREVTAVTGASLLISREHWMNLAGFDEQLSQQYQDVDLCLRARESGLAVYIDNSNFLYHLESQTVKIDLNSYRVVKKRGDEHKYFLRRWRNYLLTPDNFISEVPIELRN